MTKQELIKAVKQLSDKEKQQLNQELCTHENTSYSGTIIDTVAHCKTCGKVWNC